jgi:hypothetical protein
MPALLYSLRFEYFLPFRRNGAALLTDEGSSADVALTPLSSPVPSILSVEGTLSVRFGPFRSRGS